MINHIKNKYGTASFAFPLTTLMGILFGIDAFGIVIASLVMYVTVLVLMVMDEYVVIEYSDNMPLYTEAELIDMDNMLDNSVQHKITIIKNYLNAK